MTAKIRTMTAMMPVVRRVAVTLLIWRSFPPGWGWLYGELGCGLGAGFWIGVRIGLGGGFGFGGGAGSAH